MQDLKGLLPSTPLIGNSSMAEGNTISDQAGSYTAPGSVSEQTASVTPRQPVAGLPAPPQPVGTEPPDRKASEGYRPSPVSWGTLPVNGYSKETP